MQHFSLEILPGNLLKNVVPGEEVGDGDSALYHRGFPGAVVSLRRLWIRPKGVRRTLYLHRFSQRPPG